MHCLSLTAWFPLGVGLEAGLVPAGTYAGCWRADKNPEEIERELADRTGLTWEPQHVEVNGIASAYVHLKCDSVHFIDLTKHIGLPVK